MKIKELKENEPLEVIEVTNHMEIPPVPGRAIGRSYKKEILEEKKIQMRIFTDGEIEKQKNRDYHRGGNYFMRFCGWQNLGKYGPKCYNRRR